jgi:hypothetical protein
MLADTVKTWPVAGGQSVVQFVGEVVVVESVAFNWSA